MSDIYDFISHESSSCCDANLTITGICLECGEHSEPAEEEEEQPSTNSLQ